MKLHEEVTYKTQKEILRGLVRAMPGHKIPTPFFLIEEILALIFKQIRGKKKGVKIAVLFNTEFVLALIEKHKIKPGDITLFGDDKYKKALAKAWGCGYHDADKLLKENSVVAKQKYDAVVGNPPYQSGTGRGQGNHTHWQKFVNIAVNKLVKPHGHVAFIHPNGWRNYGGSFSRTAKMLKKIDMLYLNMNSREKGEEVFGKATSFDYYVAKMSNTADFLTKVIDEMGKVTHLNIKDMLFIPSFGYDHINELIAKDGEEKVELLYERSMYGTDKANMSEEKTADNPHPCVYYIPTNKPPSFRYSSEKKGMFGKPKVIFATMADAGILIDKKGKYGLCQFAAGIVDAPENLDSIYEAITSEDFRHLMKSVQVAGAGHNRRVISKFRKDFWKDFV